MITNRHKDGGLMKAVRIHSFGGSDRLTLEAAPRPRPGGREALVKVIGAGVNPVDWKTRKGDGVAGMLPPFPVILGWDVSGRIVETGKDAGGFKEGDEVFGLARFPAMGGAYAEYASAPVEHLARKPSRIDHITAASVPLAALTAWQALFEIADLGAGQKILIHAAAGGVGHLAVQLAKWKGARVTGTASRGNLDFIRGLGADEAFDYTAAPFEESLRDFDVVLDTVGGDVAARSYPVLRRGGTLVSLSQADCATKARRYFVRYESILVKPDGNQLGRIAGLIDEGRIKPVVETVLPLSEAAFAHELSERGRTRGKIVLAVSQGVSQDVSQETEP